MNYDPNLTRSGNTAIHTVKLVFGLWEHRKEFKTEVRGNCRGLDVIDSAIGSVFESLEHYDEGDGEIIKTIILKDKNGGELESTDMDDQREDWLKDMLVSAEIIDIKPE